MTALDKMHMLLVNIAKFVKIFSFMMESFTEKVHLDTRFVSIGCANYMNKLIFTLI